MAILKSGTYRFNDVLSTPSVAIEQSLNYELPCSVSADGAVVDFNATCSMIVPYFEDINEATTTYLYFVLDTISAGDVVVEEHITEFEAYVSTEGWRSVSNAMFGVNEELAELLTDWGRIITIPTAQDVSAEFYNWFTVNSVEVVDGVQISGVWKFKDVLTNPDIGTAESLAGNVRFKVVGLQEEAEFDLFNIYHREGTLFEYSYIITSAGLTVMVYADGEYEDLVIGTVSFNHEWLAYPEFGVTDSNIWKTIDFGTEPQTVSTEFYEWLTANATLVPEKDIYYSIKKDFLTNIANSIRAKTGKTDKMSVNQMSAEIDSITGGECEKVEEYNNIVIIEQGGVA